MSNTYTTMSVFKCGGSVLRMYTQDSKNHFSCTKKCTYLTRQIIHRMQRMQRACTVTMSNHEWNLGCAIDCRINMVVQDVIMESKIKDTLKVKVSSKKDAKRMAQSTVDCKSIS